MICGQGDPGLLRRRTAARVGIGKTVLGWEELFVIREYLFCFGGGALFLLFVLVIFVRCL